MNIQALLSEKVRQAMIAAGAPADCEPQVRQSAKVQFGDYQANGMMAVAKKLGMAPRQLAEQVLTHLDLNGIASKVEIAGPGFINIFLDPAFLAEHVQQALASDRLGVATPEKQTIVVDYSAPNVAKEMHVGHLRSTIIGDAAVRTLEFLGHKVIRANHVGDWGTQFGMLIAWLEKQQQENAGEMELADLEGFYRDAKKHYDEDEEFAERARNYVVKLQSGDEYFREMWRKLVDITMTQNQITYDRLNVTLTRDDVMGESLYNPMLPGIVADLKAKGLAVESEGATVVFLDEFKNKEGEPMGVIIQKKDGGYLYTTTDIACAKYRYETLHADRVLYYIDSRQHQHLMQAWAIVRKAGYVPESVPLEHHMFGMMLGKDGKPLNAIEKAMLKKKQDESKEKQLGLGTNPVIIPVNAGGRPDPFLPYTQIQQEKMAKSLAFDIIAPPTTVPSEDPVVDQVVQTKISGIMYDSSRPSAIINVGGADQLVHKGDTFKDCKVLDITRNSVVIKYKNNVYQATVGQTLGEGVNLNPVSNLSKQFGGLYSKSGNNVIEFNN